MGYNWYNLVTWYDIWVCLKLGHYPQNCVFGWEIDGGDDDDDDDDSPLDFRVPYLQSNPDISWCGEQNFSDTA